MIGLLQRVTRARVEIEQEVVGAIAAGLLVLVCAEREDSERECEKLLEKILNYRVFADEAGKMNRSLRQVQGGLLLVPQFTLAADTNSGTRPSFTPAAAPALGDRLFAHFCELATQRHSPCAWGRFGADMKVHLVNDGPVTFWLRVGPEQDRATFGASGQ